MQAFFNWLSRILPYCFIPKNQGNRNGENYDYSEKEDRERFAESSHSRLQHLLKKCSLRRKILKARQKYNLRGLYQLVGEITLIHAHCEQELKAFMVYISGQSLSYDNLHGGNLRKEAEETVSKRVPAEFVKEFKNWLVELRDLSKRRDQAVKTIYATNENTLEFSKVDPVKFSSFSLEVWITPAPLKELHKLKEELNTCLRNLFKMRWKLLRASFPPTLGFPSD